MLKWSLWCLQVMPLMWAILLIIRGYLWCDHQPLMWAAEVFQMPPFAKRVCNKASWCICIFFPKSTMNTLWTHYEHAINTEQQSYFRCPLLRNVFAIKLVGVLAFFFFEYLHFCLLAQHVYKKYCLCMFVCEREKERVRLWEKEIYISHTHEFSFSHKSTLSFYISFSHKRTLSFICVISWKMMTLYE